MKKLIAFIVGFMMCSLTFAQLGAPKITVRDTFFVVMVTYKGADLAKADWPCDMIIEDAVKLTVAGYNYTKGNMVVNESRYMAERRCHMDWQAFEGVCNGKKEGIMITKPSKDCSAEVEPLYGIGDYVFATYSLASIEEMLCEQLVSSIPDESRKKWQQTDDNEFNKTMTTLESTIDSLIETMDITKNQKTIIRRRLKDCIIKLRNEGRKQ